MMKTGPSVAEMIEDPRLIADGKTRVETERAEHVERLRLRIMWAAAGGGPEGVCAECAAAVIRFAENEGRSWTPKALRALHRKLCAERGMKFRTFFRTRKSVGAYLFRGLV